MQLARRVQEVFNSRLTGTLVPRRIWTETLVVQKDVKTRDGEKALIKLVRKYSFSARTIHTVCKSFTHCSAILLLLFASLRWR